MIARLRRLRNRLGDDSGLTLIELLIASLILLALLGSMFAAVVASTKGSQAAKISNDSNEEARIMLTRMVRELREAKQIVSVTNPGATGVATPTCDTFNAANPVAITFDVDFSGDGTIQANAADPEELTYSYDPSTHRVVESAAGQSYPVLAGNVQSFKLTYTSRLQQYDGLCDGSADGVVYWSDLDKATADNVGNNNGQLDQELSSIDSVTVELTMQPPGSSAQQTYRTQVDLRNAAE